MIPEAIGGRRTVRGLLHRSCNNTTGHTWDAALAKQLQPLALHFEVKRQQGRTPRMAVTTTAGEALLLGPGGTLEMARPEITRTTTAAGENLSIVVGSMSTAREVLEGHKRKHPGIDVESALATAEVRRSYARGAIPLTLDFGGHLSGRSLVKSALAQAHAAGVPVAACGDALTYLRETDGEPCFGYYYVEDLVVDRPTAVPLHCVAVEASPASGLILGYVELFGIHRAVVCLGRGYTGDAVERVYAFDPRSGAELDLRVQLSFDEEDIRAIYNYERDDAAGRQAAFGNVFGPALSAHQEREGARAIQEALQHALTNCGAEPNARFTAVDFANIRRLFADQATPWFQHVTGLPERLARLQALAFIDHVLKSA